MMWGAWWLFQRDRLGLRLVHWASVGILLCNVLMLVDRQWVVSVGASFLNDADEAQTKTLKFIHNLESSLQASVLPAMLLAAVRLRSTRAILEARSPAEGDEPAPADPDAAASPELPTPSDMVQCVGVIIAWASIAIGAAGALQAGGRLHYHMPLVVQQIIYIHRWPIEAIRGLLEDASWFLLIMGGLMLLKDRRRAGAVIITGSASRLVMLLLPPFTPVHMTWSVVLSEVSVSVMIHLPLIFAMVLIAGLLWHRGRLEGSIQSTVGNETNTGL